MPVLAYICRYSFDSSMKNMRSRAVKSYRNRMFFMLLSKLYRQMYANTGIATDSARHARSERMARLLAKQCRRVFVARPMPDLQVPV